MTPTRDEISRVMSALAKRRKPYQCRGGRRMCACGKMSQEKAKKIGHKCRNLLTKQRT